MNNLTTSVRRGEASVREAAASGVVTLMCLTMVILTLQYTAAFPARSVPVVIGVFALLLVFLLVSLPRHHPPLNFGAANRVTLARAAMVAMLIGYVGVETQPMLAWCVMGVATLAACLDALDGLLARRHGTVSAFGARFDMETDAGLILVLSLLVWQFDKAGPWVIAAGLMRYVFVLAGLWLPWLRTALPSSLRRQSVCVVQVVTLIMCLAPVVPAPWSAALAAFGLAALSTSFLLDVAWLAREARQQ